MTGVVAIVQARMTSRRLPGKVLKPILGRPMLELQIERVRRARSLDHLVVATSDAPEDDAVAQLCVEIDADCFRGTLDDVLERIHGAAAARGAAHVIRLTGDCPLADAEIIDRVVRLHLAERYDYTSNVAPPSWPDGLDVEAIRFAVLEAAWREARLASEREHVTLFVRNRPERFRIGNLAQERDLSGLRWTVDDPEDLALVRGIYETLYPTNPAFSTGDVLALLAARPELGAINAHIGRNEGLARSLATERR